MAPALTIDWAKIPRIILVDNPDTEIIQQDLIDELRTQESSIHNTDKDAILDGDGKQTLDTAGTLVGITNTLLSALLGFAADTTAKSQGTATTADPLGETLEDVGATFQTDGVLPGAVIINFDDFSVASVIEVISETEILHLPLVDGTLDTWVIGNNYKIWNIKQGIISGGNLVSVDTAGDPVATPIYPTPFTQVILASSSSPTLQELADIQQAAFGDEVHVDPVNGTAGTAYPQGTKKSPVDNMVDALSIRAFRGFDGFHILGDITLASGDYSGFIFKGDSPYRTTIVVDSAAIVTGCEFRDCELHGVVDSDCEVRFCHVDDVTLTVPIHVEDCGFHSTSPIVLAGTGGADFINCHSMVPGLDTPVINCGGTGVSLGVRGLIGGIKLTTKTGSEKVSIDVLSGQVVLDGTVTVVNPNDIVVRGVGGMTNNAVNPDNVNYKNLITGKGGSLS